MPERLHLDELKRVEQGVNALLKAWRKLNQQYSQLEKDHQQLLDKHEQQKNTHERSLDELRKESDGQKQQQNEAYQAKVAGVEQHWQQQYAALEAQTSERVQQLEQAHHNELKELQATLAQQKAQFTEQLEAANCVKDALIDRVRGVEV
ncbi:hypothetical protein L0B52_03355 [Suttonella sp. R2A3]|uniref:hypothetical protein n=1 Tax=Suttonella sp. R2A3 TaxID=2908648 RepID=UPI001F345A53|nr:hypothetical protein [Suttonella sp. R2A3]UJF25200.1 hypothetical protein L0B52_03355 [Suttonella sp. R2A3]